MTNLPQHGGEDAQARQAEHVVIVVPGPGLAVAVAQIVEAHGLGGCVTLVEADHLDGSERLFGDEIVGRFAVEADLERFALRPALNCADPFIERARPERDWKQRERQRPRRKRR